MYKIFFVIIALLGMELYAWTSSGSGVKYEMDDITALSDSVSFNLSQNLYDITCGITILQGDTLKINPGEALKFYRTRLTVYGVLIAVGEADNKIYIGDPEHTLQNSGELVDGIFFIDTSKNGESIMDHCIFNGVQNEYWHMGGIICIDSSPAIKNSVIKNIPRNLIETGGASGIKCIGKSYPLIYNCSFYNIRGVAIQSGLWEQDTENYPSPAVVNTNIFSSVTGFYIYPYSSNDVVVLFGGFLDNCYLQVGATDADTSFGDPEDTVGDGICNTTSTNHIKKFAMIDGVVNPRSEPVTGIDNDGSLLPVTSAIIALERNYPNPFNPETTIEYSIHKDGVEASLFIYNTKGNLIRILFENRHHSKGSFYSSWDGRNDHSVQVSAGVYFLKLFTDGELTVKQALLVK